MSCFANLNPIIAERWRIKKNLDSILFRYKVYKVGFWKRIFKAVHFLSRLLSVWHCVIRLNLSVSSCFLRQWFQFVNSTHIHALLYCWWIDCSSLYLHTMMLNVDSISFMQVLNVCVCVFVDLWTSLLELFVCISSSRPYSMNQSAFRFSYEICQETRSDHKLPVENTIRLLWHLRIQKHSHCVWKMFIFSAVMTSCLFVC